MRRHLGDRCIDVLVPAAAAGEHQGRWLVAPVHRASPSADQVGDVLPRLQLAEEGDVAAAQAQPGSDPRLVGVAGNVEQVGVDTVVGDVDPGRVGVEDPDQLVAGGLARDDDASSPAYGGAGG